MTAIVLMSNLGLSHAERLGRVKPVGVYGAQSHVIDLNDQTYASIDEGVDIRKIFPLLADRDMLFKVNFIQVGSGNSIPTNALEVTVTMRLGDEETLFTLDSPNNGFLPEEFDTDRANIRHSFDDSYSTTIPKELLKPGLVWSIQWCLNTETDKICQTENEKPLEVQSPVNLTVNIYPFEFFGWSWKNTGAGIDVLIDEMAQKLPISNLVVKGPVAEYYDVDEVLVSAQAGYPPRIINNRKEDGKVIWANQIDTGSAWNRALVQASGSNFGKSFMLMGMKYPGAKGKGGNNGMTTSVMPRKSSFGLAWHESLHMFNLFHWGENRRGGLAGAGIYPYIGKYSGVDAHATQGHVGPSWGYDARNKEFLSPTIMQQNGFARWRIAPERRGSKDAHRNLGMNMTHLSDWSANRIMQMIVTENTTELESSEDTANEQSVYSILMQASTATELLDKPYGVKILDIDPMAKVHAPIGPYPGRTRGLIDPSDPAQRNIASESAICNELQSFCDFSIRVKRDGAWKVYLLERPVDWKSTTQAWPHERSKFSEESYVTVAINLPESEGVVEEAQLLLTPDVLINPWPISPKVLASWTL